MRDELVDRAASLAPRTGRRILGIAGAPGAGKSTLVLDLLDALTARGVRAAWLPMDGFHLADVQLDRLGRRERKGAIDTFDDAGYAAILRRVIDEPETTVYAPGFERELEQPIAAATAIEPDARLVLTEGNYLLADTGAWPAARATMAEVWFVDTPAEERRRRLVARHIFFGKSEEAARAWVRDVDESNAGAILAARRNADLAISGW